ncbi:transmembrane protein, putative (macronuclear) [Tetrahymena thermophila SB210]|uniref:Transmembrane protein, putative n=1 Tax=Tetrahymena thermophila (strain SB210) TaxID=312017 RepID=W7XCT9_TETTS|nr:transmembrane protein, putative [Tetrahymena thermophila SB210]EWS71616.1 transmembrane protein, putative [Tetrahymena thermophila SB210]|eukprot:XP_012655861.1 transmembrane protein, putative [Tetrahymena thermophila SB210]
MTKLNQQILDYLYQIIVLILTFIADNPHYALLKRVAIFLLKQICFLLEQQYQWWIIQSRLTMNLIKTQINIGLIQEKELFQMNQIQKENHFILKFPKNQYQHVLKKEEQHLKSQNLQQVKTKRKQ